MLFELRFWSIFLLITTKYADTPSKFTDELIPFEIDLCRCLCEHRIAYTPSQQAIRCRSTKFHQNTHKLAQRSKHIDMVS